MSGEIVVPETPNWLQSLEEKRERRLKARLGHEAGAGAPCLKCGDKCPGLDLHFWRKACKICRCPKEEHDVHDDDIYGWAQFQLLGSKPNKIKTKIVLPGKKDEIELEWAPKGQKETVDKYLKTLPPEVLPVKGSQAAQERKQMLQKQIPIHDIDPSLCHELNEEEIKKMEEYIAHIKKSSVGVGQIVNLSSVIKANLHNISPQEAHIIASRYSKGIPFGEIVKLQSGLAKNLEKLTLNDPKNPKTRPNLPNMQPNRMGSNIIQHDVQNPLVAAKFKDITLPWYTDSSPHKGLPPSQYAQAFKPGHPGSLSYKDPDNQSPDYSIDHKLLQGTNFDPSRTPSQFLGYNTPGYRPVQHEGPHPQSQFKNTERISHDKVFDRPLGNDVSSNVGKSKALKPGGLVDQKEGLPYKVSGNFRPGNIENIEVYNSGPNYAQNLHRSQKLLHSEQYGFENPYFNQNVSDKDPKYSQNPDDTVSPLKTNLGKLPRYDPGKYDPQVDPQDPKAPKSVKDLIYSTYDPSKGHLPEDNNKTGIKNKNIDPLASGYDPNVTFNTYKRDPSVIKYENPALLDKNDPAQAIGTGGKTGFGSGNHKNLEQGYFDPKTGKYIPGHPNYDPRNLQYPCDTGYLDPKREKYVTEGGILDSRNPEQENIGPGHRNYDPTNPQYPYGPEYFDPKTGKYIAGDNNPEGGNCDSRNQEQGHFGPGHSNDDPTNPQYPYGPRYFDPKTGKYIIGDGNTIKGCNYNPKSPGQGNFGPRHRNYDILNSQFPYGPGYFDPKTGKYITEDSNNPEGENYEYKNLEKGNFDPGHPNYDPKNPDRPGYLDPRTGKYVIRDDINPDPRYLDKGNYDPGHPDGDLKNPFGSGYFDPKMGKHITGTSNLDPKTGNYLSVKENPSNFDPAKLQNYVGHGNIDPSGNFGPNRHQNIPGSGQYPDSKNENPNTTPIKSRKALSQLQPGHITIPEDYLEPHMVNVGAIQDINPDIRAATTEMNPGFDNESVYSDNGADYSPESIREILNNIKLPDCHYCKKPFEENEYAVTVDRANVLFHAQCFKCAGCNQSLADNIYFYHKETDNVYCGRDYAKIKGYPRCTACDELIFTKEYCLAENSTFHLKHFCCFQCDTPLAGQDYTLEDEKPYCLPCYESSKAAKCSTCENVIKPDEVGCQLNGVHFHAEDRCFRCIVCSVPLMGKKLLLRNEKLYCSHDCFNSVKK